MSSKSIKQVMDEQVDDLMSIPGVVGVAIGELSDGRPCIKILVVQADDTLKKQIPVKLGGFPVEIEVTGTIRGLPDSQP